MSGVIEMMARRSGRKVNRALNCFCECAERRNSHRRIMCRMICGRTSSPVQAEPLQEIVRQTWHERQAAEKDRERERRTYPGRTVAMLRRYMRYSLETDGCRHCWGANSFARR